jgi:nucleotide-binding universal stress UspA family protein
MKRILVPITSAPGSQIAVDAARHLASLFGSSVELINVREGKKTDPAEEQLEEALRRLRQADVPCSVVHLQGDRVGRLIVRQAKGADLIVMRSEAHRAPGSETGQVRSTTLDVLRHAPCPLLAVTVRTTSMLNPLLAYNGSPQSRAAMESAIAILAPKLIRKGAVIVVTSDEHMAERLAADIQSLGRKYQLELDTHWSPGKPATAILDYGRTHRHDMLVMGAMGRSWLREQIFGSTTNEMLRQCSVPIWMAQ